MLKFIRRAFGIYRAGDDPQLDRIVAEFEVVRPRLAAAMEQGKLTFNDLAYTAAFSSRVTPAPAARADQSSPST